MDSDKEKTYKAELKITGYTLELTISLLISSYMLNIKTHTVNEIQ